METNLKPKLNIKSLTVFWVRMLGWITFSCIIPVLVFAKKFGLFKANIPETDTLGNEVSSPSIALNGWGIVACILIGLTVISIIKEIIAASPKYSFIKQCFVGLIKIICPLAICLGICIFLQDCITQVTFCLTTLVICQCAAVPLNPLPKWRYEKKGIENYAGALSVLTEFVKNKV